MTNFEIVNKLIGDISPCGRSEVDAERLENLKAMCELVDELVISIHDITYIYRHSYEHSVKEIAEYATNFIERLKD